MKKKKNEEQKPEQEEQEQEEEQEEEQGAGQETSVVFLNSPFEGEADPTSKLRIVNLYGEVDEERASETICTMLYLKETGQVSAPDEDSPSQECEPFKFLISTPGGAATEMFAIYDLMCNVRKECEIHTIGLGKVMSAGVLLLAAGTKGKRTIGKHCRIMLHGVVGASYGSIYNLEVEMDEIKWLQEQYTSCLIKETKMTKRYIKKLLDKKINIYLTAKEAIELGIADIII